MSALGAGAQAMAGLGGAVGGLGVGGVLLLAAHLRARRPSLDARLAPYLRPAGAAAAPSGPGTPVPTLERLLAPVLRDAVRLTERLGSPAAELSRRLARAGREQSVEQFRSEQVALAAVGLAVGLALGLALVAGRGTHPMVAGVLVLVCAVTGVVARDHLLGREVRRREARLLAELPTVAELLALAVAAGEGPLRALERVAATTHGALPEEIGRAVADVHAGTPLPEALDRMAERSGLVPLSRFVAAVAVAVERGTPLAEVLRSQADDVRDAGRRALMETGGRKEVAMMVPVVFLILPVTVVFAVFPGLVALRFEP